MAEETEKTVSNFSQSCSVTVSYEETPANVPNKLGDVEKQGTLACFQYVVSVSKFFTEQFMLCIDGIF